MQGASLTQTLVLENYSSMESRKQIMAFNLLVSQGRIADRAAGLIEGANLVACAIEKKYLVQGIRIGTPSPSEDDDWVDSLPQAKGTLDELQLRTAENIKSGHPTLLLSNTCSAGISTLPIAFSEISNLVILYIDAHGDFNTPDTTDSGYLGGMVLSGVCGLWKTGYDAGVSPNRVVLVGARDIDKPELELLNSNGVTIIPPHKVTTEGVLNAIGDSPVWIHVDWDVLEPGFLPADYVVPNGLTPDQMETIFSVIPSSQIQGMELAEFDASTDDDENTKSVDTILKMIAPVLNNWKGMGHPLLKESQRSPDTDRLL